MLELCSCFHCGSGVESVILENERSHHSRMVGQSRCFNPQFPVRTGRTVKGLCFLTASLAFCIGIGIGVLIPLYFLPVSSDTVGHSSLSSTEPISYEHLTQTSQSVIKPISTSSEKTFYFQDDSTPDSVSSRFPEFAQIQALRNENHPDKLHQSPYPIFRRPSPNVKFVAPDSRILSLHPVHQEIPQARFNSSITSTSSTTLPTHPESKDTTSTAVLNNENEYVDGIYWRDNVEEKLPKGFTDEELKSWRRFVEESSVSKIEEGCGRMQNRLLTFGNGTRACCRYRQNFDQIQGEIFSFYLSQLLSLRNLAPSALDLIQPLNSKWTSVRQQLNLAQWAEEKPVVLTRFIPNLAPAYIPAPFRDSTRRLHPIDLMLSSNSVESLDTTELAQWSDLIVFDYLTANLDRMVNNLYNLQWNPSMMEAPAHNLAKDVSTGLLVFLDNESGLLHGYRLLDKYEQYHRIMLDSLCVFRRSTAEAVKRLHRDKNVGHHLKTMFQSLEPALVDYLPMIPDKSIKILNHRIDRVFDQISKCESLYMS